MHAAMLALDSTTRDDIVWYAIVIAVWLVGALVAFHGARR
jgi:hypothetical protein